MSKQHLTDADIRYMVTCMCILTDTIAPFDPNLAKEMLENAIDIETRFKKEDN